TVYALAYRWLGDHAAADEVVQATFLKAYTHLVDFRGNASFRSWLCGIALNQARTQSRARRRERTVSLDEVPEAALPQDDTGPTEPSLRGRLACLVSKLPPPPRAVVTLPVDRDLPFRDIARSERLSGNS